MQNVTRGVATDTILFPKWETLDFLFKFAQNYFMKNIYRTLSVLFLASALSFASCEEETLVNPDLVLVNGLDITGGQEVPAVTTNGAGNLDVRYDKGTKQLTLTFAWGNLSDTVIDLHLQGPAAQGVIAPVLHQFSNFQRSKNGSHTETFTVDGSVLKEDELLNNLYYVNILTRNNPTGEIRGQILMTGE